MRGEMRTGSAMCWRGNIQNLLDLMFRTAPPFKPLYLFTNNVVN